MLDLSEDELYNIMAKRPRVKGSKVMDVLIKWAKKRFALEALKVEKKEEVVEKEEKKVEKVKDVEMAEEKKDDEKKEASKQILIRIAGFLQDPDLCDASFIVEDGADKEEIRAPSQLMAMFYNIDSRNLVHFLKNTIKYDTPDLRDVVIARLLKDADKAFDYEQMLDLSEDELYNIMAKRPQVKGSKVMDELIKWVKKRFALEAPKAEKKKKLLRKKRKKCKKSRMLK